MGLFFNRNKEYKMLDISGDTLIYLLEEAKKVCEIKVNNGHYFSGPEIMFNYKEKIHFIGIKYNKKGVNKKIPQQYNEDQVTVYLDKKIYNSIEELAVNGKLENECIKNINKGIEVDIEYQMLIDKSRY